VVDPSLALQKAFVAALRGQTDAAGNVFDQVPASNPFPRVTLGEGQSIGDFADCIEGTESFLAVDVWSRAVGFPEAKRIGDQVRSALHDAALVLDGHRLVLIEFQDARALRDPDGLTSHIAMTFRALTEPDGSA
jgi:hypothetical protein